MADEVTLPTREEIAALPRWAKVAYAARCARRALPLLKHHWPRIPNDVFVRFADAVARTECGLPTLSLDSGAVANASHEDGAPTSAGCAAVAMGAAIGVGSQTTTEKATDFTYSAASHTLLAYSSEWTLTHNLPVLDLLEAIRSDFDWLVDEIRHKDGGQSVGQLAFPFGPLWPNGVPKDWPEADPEERLQVTVGVPEEAKPEQTAEYLNRLHALLNKLNIQNGGAGITLDTVRREVPQEAPVPVGGGS